MVSFLEGFGKGVVAIGTRDVKVLCTVGKHMDGGGFYH